MVIDVVVVAAVVDVAMDDAHHCSSASGMDIRSSKEYERLARNEYTRHLVDHRALDCAVMLRKEFASPAHGPEYLVGIGKFGLT